MCHALCRVSADSKARFSFVTGEKFNEKMRGSVRQWAELIGVEFRHLSGGVNDLALGQLLRHSDNAPRDTMGINLRLKGKMT